MNELRKDYLLDRWVLLNEDRGNRPTDFVKKRTAKKTICPFCSGNEKLTPPEITRIEENNKWSMRVFPNKFPAVTSDVGWQIKEKGIFTSSPSFGVHEVIVETPKHNEQLADFSLKRINRLLQLYCYRINELSADKRIKQVAVFKNEGFEAGASMSHSHTQIIAYNKLAETIGEKLKASNKYIKKTGNCPYCEIIKKEKNSPRFVYENDSILVYAPFAPRFAYEVRISPKRHVNRITELENKELLDLAKAIKYILVRLKKIGASYNMYFRNAPKGKFLHFHVKINPRLFPWGGFEYETGCVINAVSPETAAGFYRKR